MSTQSETLEFPDKGLIDEYGFYMKQRPSVTLVVQRDVTDPLLIRNTADDRAETQVLNGVTRAQSNPEKFTTKERLSGLHLLRELDNGDGDLISDEYVYNEPPDFPDAINMDALTYGITGTGDDDYAMKARLFAGYTYTVGEYDIMNAEVRNKAHESGTMNYEEDGEMEHSQGLFEEVRVQPGNAFVHFLTLEAATPGILTYTLHNVLNTHGYGARETRSGKTIENTIRAVVLADHPALLSTGEFLTNHDPETSDADAIGTAIGNYLAAQRRENWDVYGDSGVDDVDPFPDWFTTLTAVAGRRRADATAQLRDLFASETSDAKDNIPKV